MDFEKVLDQTKRAIANERAAAQAVTDSVSATADLAVLRNSAATVQQLAEVMALTKADPT